MTVKDFKSCFVSSGRDKMYIIVDDERIDCDCLASYGYKTREVKRMEIDAVEDEYDGGHVIIYFYV